MAVLLIATMQAVNFGKQRENPSGLVKYSFQMTPTSRAYAFAETSSFTFSFAA